MTGMRVLVVGSGAREHAIAWKLASGPHKPDILAAPGNAGTASVGTNHDVDAEDIDGLVRLALEESVDMTIVGPEAPLDAGIVDRFEERGLKAFGPSQAAARIESSKSFAKRVMADCGVPTARADVFSNHGDAMAHVRKARSRPTSSRRMDWRLARASSWRRPRRMRSVRSIRCSWNGPWGQRAIQC